MGEDLLRKKKGVECKVLIPGCVLFLPTLEVNHPQNRDSFQ